MGLIRKTASISTLGLIKFRSKKELLRKAEKERRAAESEVAAMQRARQAVDARLVESEKRARRAELQALQQAKRADGAKGGRRARRKAAANQAIDAVEDFVSTKAPQVEQRAKELGRRGRKAAAKAAKQAEAVAEKAQKEARKRGKEAKAKLDEVSDAATEFVRERR